MGMTVSRPCLERFLKGRRLGLTIDDAAKYGGFNQKTYHDWKKRAKLDPKSEEAAFMNECEQVKAEGKVHHLANVYKAGKKDWRASAKWLALNGYAEKQQLEHSGAIARPVVVDASKLTDEQLDAIAEGRNVEAAEDAQADLTEADPEE